MEMMNLKIRILTAMAVGAFILASLATTTFANTQGWNFFNTNWEEFFDDFFKRRLQASLDGTQEVPGPGDPDGEGRAKVKIRTEKNELCLDMEVENIDTANATHIHHAPAGASGAVVIILPIPSVEGEAEGCLSADPDLLEKIKAEPEDYYINVHNTNYPDGAIRGQLSRKL